MHMADALISPAVGISMLAVSAGVLGSSMRRVRQKFDEKQIPLMGVMGAFVFAAQMINFSIPGTGSSGHIGGAVLLAAVLGPYAAFMVLSCVLIIQALFFADGGILALGCNIFNIAFFGCFITYPLIYRPLAGQKEGDMMCRTDSRGIYYIMYVSLQFGAFLCMLENVLGSKQTLVLHIRSAYAIHTSCYRCGRRSAYSYGDCILDEDASAGYKRDFVRNIFRYSCYGVGNRAFRTCYWRWTFAFGIGKSGWA